MIPGPDSMIPGPDSMIPGPDSKILGPDSMIPGPDSMIPRPGPQCSGRAPQLDDFVTATGFAGGYLRMPRATTHRARVTNRLYGALSFMSAAKNVSIFRPAKTI